VAYDFDVIQIGLGPAGMAVSIMASEMGLKVGAIEAHKVGGECMNVGCIPSKSLLQMAKTRATIDKMEEMGLQRVVKPAVVNPFQKIATHLQYISEKKTLGMFKKTELLLGQGKASFVNAHTVAVGDRKITGRRIFLAVGTRPALPPIAGIETVDCLTNETMFNLERVPESLIVIGGGAIACEMAQAFARLGSQVTLIMRGPRVLWREDQDAANLLMEVFQREGIRVLTNRTMEKIERRDGRVFLTTKEDGVLEAERVLAGTGRRYDLKSLQLENAGVKYSDKDGITVNKYLQTSQGHIYAIGDCNGFAQLSHAAMHQGMIALMNAMTPWPFKQDYRKFVVPWTVFTEPALSYVGLTEAELKEKGIRYETIRINYADYGAAIAEGFHDGFVKVHASTSGRIYGACVVGEGSAEMINEWGLAIQNNIRMHKIMLLQHSFPGMGFLNKRVSENWMMNRMGSASLRQMARLMYRL